MNTERHTAIYLRVSTVGQDHASQLPELKCWAESHNGSARWYRDKFTGRTMDRPGMAKMMADFRTGKLDRIVIWRLDRLGRTSRGLCELFDELRAHKVDLVSLRDGFSLNTPSGRLHARILASVAEFETEVRAERIRAGQAAARAKGKRWGGSRAGRYARVTPEQVKAIAEMAHAGEKITKIGKITGLSRTTIYRVLRNQKPPLTRSA